MSVKGVERDVEQAVAQGIIAKLATDGITGVSVNTLRAGAPGEEPQRPYIYIECEPLEHQGASNRQWMGTMQVNIMTRHLTGKDRDANNLFQIYDSICEYLDFGDSKQYSDIPLGTLDHRRTGGDYDFEDSENAAQVQCALRLCA